MTTHTNSVITDAPPQTNEDVNMEQDRNASNKRTSLGTYTNGKDSKDHPAATPHGGAHGNPGFSGFPEAINPGTRKSCRRDRYQSTFSEGPGRDLTIDTKIAPNGEGRGEIAPFPAKCPPGF
ncbi:hypothetical protein DdX_10923 [Ditylenchus destructor]|uniref:Uncharacterized protein n=1 Tax=Ditylenchus destructor TaxID=166010 RepID=A0AAD4R4R6_9BILA|nr:hypothetical protein DdX_10923 [Ditylenchus destructor]